LFKYTVNNLLLKAAELVKYLGVHHEQNNMAGVPSNSS